MISVSSVGCTLIIYSIVLAGVCLVHKYRPNFVMNGGASVLLLVAAIDTLRLVLPFELPLTRAIRSWPMGEPLRLIRTYPDIITFVLVIWAAGVIRVVYEDIREVYRAYITSSRYRSAEEDCTRIQEIAKELHISCPVVVSPDVGMAYVERIFRYTIYLPVLELPDKEIEFILRHERQHILNHDFLIKCFFRLLFWAMWWNPAVRWFWRVLPDLLELRCDEKMTGNMDDEDRMRYVKMLQGMTAALTGRELKSPVAVDEYLAASGKKLMIQRTHVILYGTIKPSWRACVAFVCVTVALFFASYLVIIQPAGLPPADNFVGTPKIYYEEECGGIDVDEAAGTAFVIKGSDGRYQLFINYKFSRYLSETEITSDEYSNLYIFEEAGQK